MSKRTYVPRNSFVLCKLVSRGTTDGGVVLPETNKGGKRVLVVAVGEHVFGLKEGDEVLVIGKSNDPNTFPLPFDHEHFCVDESDIALVIKED